MHLPYICCRYFKEGQLIPAISHSKVHQAYTHVHRCSLSPLHSRSCLRAPSCSTYCKITILWSQRVRAVALTDTSVIAAVCFFISASNSIYSGNTHEHSLRVCPVPWWFPHIRERNDCFFKKIYIYFSRSACERCKACEKMDCSLDMTNNNSGALSMSKSLSATINQYAVKTQRGYSFLHCRVY